MRVYLSRQNSTVEVEATHLGSPHRSFLMDSGGLAELSLRVSRLVFIRISDSERAHALELVMSTSASLLHSGRHKVTLSCMRSAGLLLGLFRYTGHPLTQALLAWNW